MSGSNHSGSFCENQNVHLNFSNQNVWMLTRVAKIITSTHRGL